MSNITKSIIGTNKIFPEKRHSNTRKLLSYTKNWLNLSNMSNRKKVGIQIIKRSSSMSSLDKLMNDTIRIRDHTIEDNHVMTDFQLDISSAFTAPLQNSPKNRKYEFSSISTEMPKRFSENCLSDLCNSLKRNGLKVSNKPSVSSLESLASLSSSDSIPGTCSLTRFIRSISNDALLRDATAVLTTDVNASLPATPVSSYYIQSPRNNRHQDLPLFM